MIWNDTAFLLSKNRYSENSLIAEVFTENYGKVSGIIFGGTSKKIKNYLQIGNRVYINYNSKFENKIGYFKIEIEEALSPLYFDNPQKLSCITAAMNLIKLLTAESEKNKNIFDLIVNFFVFIKKDNWIKDYIYWELELYKTIGYDLQFKDLVNKEKVGNELRYFSKSQSEKKVIPNFLIEKTQSPEDIATLIRGLKIVSDYLEKTILKPNNLNQPISRLQFINSLK